MAVTGVTKESQVRSRLILVVDPAPSKTKGMVAFQEVPLTGLLADSAKVSFTIEDSAEIPVRLAEAFSPGLRGT